MKRWVVAACLVCGCFMAPCGGGLALYAQSGWVTPAGAEEMPPGELDTGVPERLPGLYVQMGGGGTAVTLGHRLLYLDGLGAEYLARWLKSAVVGGFAPVFLNCMMAYCTGHLIYELPVTGFGGFRAPLIGLTGMLALVSDLAYLLQVPSARIYFALRSGGRYALPALLNSFYLPRIAQGLGWPVDRTSLYLAVLASRALETGVEAWRQLRTQSPVTAALPVSSFRAGGHAICGQGRVCGCRAGSRL